MCRLLDVQEQAISTILGKTVYKRHVKDDVLCKQGELANDFFIIVSGQCSVQVTTYNSQDGNTVTRRVGNLLFDACCDVHNVDTTTVAMFSIDANVHIHAGSFWDVVLTLAIIWCCFYCDQNDGCFDF